MGSLFLQLHDSNKDCINDFPPTLTGKSGEALC